MTIPFFLNFLGASAGALAAPVTSSAFGAALSEGARFTGALSDAALFVFSLPGVAVLGAAVFAAAAFRSTPAASATCRITIFTMIRWCRAPSLPRMHMAAIYW